jgi:hypothetical protein
MHNALPALASHTVQLVLTTPDTMASAVMVTPIQHSGLLNALAV